MRCFVTYLSETYKQKHRSKLHRYSGDHLPTVPHDPFDAVDDDSGPGSSAPPVPVYIPPVSAIPRRTRSHQAASDTEPELSEPPAQRQVSFSARLPSTRKTTRSRGVSYAIAADPPLPEIMESEKENEKEPVRTRAKDTQKRLGVGRPRAAGGAGPRQVTRAPTSRIATRRVTVQVDGESFVPGVTPQGSEIHDEGNDTGQTAVSKGSCL